MSGREKEGCEGFDRFDDSLDVLRGEAVRNCREVEGPRFVVALNRLGPKGKVCGQL